MAEFKHGFEKARMNKDMDERLVPNGEYREANNIQVTTSEGSNVGVVQNLSGNVLHATVDHTTDAVYNVPTTSSCVASIAAADKDKIYYFVSSSDLNNASGRPDICKDYILEYNTVTEKTKYVFVDIWRVKTLVDVAVSGATVFKVDDDIADSPDNTTTQNRTGIRIGMHVTGGNNNYQVSDNIIVTDVRYNSGWEITVNTAVDFNNNTEITFLAPGKNDGRVLSFSKDTLITGVNILDNFIYWTDNVNEPKKINIKRSIAGTGGVEYLIGGGVAGIGSATTTNSDTTFDGDTDYFHTRLVREHESGSGLLNVVTNNTGNEAVYTNESHVTVIRSAPTQPLELDMHRLSPDKLDSSGNSVSTQAVLSGFNWRTYDTLNPGDFTNNDEDLSRLFQPGEVVRFPQTAGQVVSFPSLEVGNFIPIALENGTHVGQVNPGDVPAFSGAPGGVCFEVGDVLLFSSQTGPNVELPPGTLEEYQIRAEVIAGPSDGPDSPSLGTTATPYVLEIKSIAPEIHPTLDQNWWVRLEVPQSLFEYKFPRFSYRYKYVDGEYSPFAPFSEMAFLPDRYSYEPKDGYNFGMVNQIRDLTLKYYHYDEDCIPQDISEIDILYKETNNPAVFVVKTLKRSDQTPIWPDLSNTSDTFLRGEFKVTTDMIHAAVPSNQLLRPWDNVPRQALAQEISANRLIYGNYLQNYNVERDPIINVTLATQETVYDYAQPSVKTMRSYQIGVVYSDRYGRETPILTGVDSQGRPNSINVHKPASRYKNRLQVSLSPDSYIPDWAEYFSYYIKETSVEYYTMASDRWYDAEDGNIWLSFPSSERNKMTEESFIELKKAHGSETAVVEPARFKILAIENEAPDEIKTSRKSLGILTNNDSIGNAAGFGYPTEGLNFMLCSSDAFNGLFVDIGDIPNRKSLVLRSAEGSISREYFVSSITDNGGGYHKIQIEEAFGIDVGFAATETVQLEIFELKVENRPEFDGRFFAKIKRDISIETYLLDSDSAGQLFHWGDLDIGYWNPRVYKAQPSNLSLEAVNIDCGDPIDRHVDDYGEFGDETNDYTTAHPTEYSGNWGFGSEIQYFLGQAGEPLITSDAALQLYQSGTGGVLDDGPSFTWCTPQGWGYWTVMASRCSGLVTGNPVVFIDAGPAWSWTSDGTIYSFGQGANDGDRPGCEYHFDYSWAVSSDSTFDNNPLGGASWGDAVSHQDTGGISGDGGNMLKEMGQPSRGIWNAGHCMDLSFTGMGDGYTGGQLNGTGHFEGQAPFAHKVSQFGAPGMGQGHETVHYFMQKLTTPGTKFRFKRDPRAIEDSLYTSTTFFNEGPFSYGNSARWALGTNSEDGAWGIRNMATIGLNSDGIQYKGVNMRQRWTITTSTPIGGDEEFGYSPIKGTNPNYWSSGAEYASSPDRRRAIHHDFPSNSDGPYDAIQIYESIQLFAQDQSHFKSSPSVWETIPPESVDLDIYYQASGLIPLTLKNRTNEEYIPIGSTISPPTYTGQGGEELVSSYEVKSWVNHNTIQLTTNLEAEIPAGTVIKVKKRRNYECNIVVSTTAAASQPNIVFHGDQSTDDPVLKLQSQAQVLDWNNCWCFGNGVESDRIRDDFNADQVDNGVKVSTGIGRQSREERRKHGLIWSGIYNSNAGVNDTNQFIMAEGITKDLNPVYGSIQRILNRNTRLIMFCEDKILRAVTNRDALYNANGKPQLVASNTVVGDVTPYKGQFGIAKNPESMAENPYAVYFADAMRGKVLRLTNEGIMPISDVGMKDYFADLMRENAWRCLGTFDQRKNEYNLTVSKKYVDTQVVPHEQQTASYSDSAKGWTSFKSFLPQHGATINNNYYTFFQGQLYKHHDETELTYYSSSAASANLTMATVVGLQVGMLVEATGVVDGSTISSISGNVVTINNNVTSLFTSQNVTFSTPHNTFYGTYYDSDVTLVFNDQKSSVKSFGLINYEGSQARIDEWDSISGNRLTNAYATNDGLVSANIDDEEYYNLDSKNGWYADSIITDLQSCGNLFFKNKEGKYYGYPTGESTSLSNLDEREFSVQGLGMATMQHDTDGYGGQVTVRVTNNTSSTYQGSDGSGGVWDDAATIASETDKWEATIGSKVVTGGATIGSSGETLQFTLSPIVNGVYSGTPLAAENLEWSGGNNVSGTSWTHDGSTNADPDDDNTIAGVAFSNNGLAGDPSNTITVTITFANGDTYPTTDVLWYIDIDEKSVKPVVNDLRDVAFEVHWEHYTTDALLDVTPDNITNPDITETLVAAGDDSSTGTFEKWKFIGNNVIEPDVSTLVYSDTFTAASNHHFTGVNYAKVNMGQYEPYYTVIQELSYTNGVVTSFDVKVYYESPSDIPDPPNDELYNLGHKILIRYDVKVSYSGMTDTVTDATHPPTVDRNGAQVPVRVYGTAGAKYNLSLELKDGDTDTTVTSNGYYNHTTKAFETLPTFLNTEFTIPSSGDKYHYISIPSISPTVKTVDLRYDVTLRAVGTTSLSSSVPTVAGDSTITQYGWRSLTIQPLTFNTGRYDSGGPASEIYYYPALGNTSQFTQSNIIVTTGGNGNTSKNPIKLTRSNSSIRVGMLVVSETYDFSGVDGSARSSGGTGTTPTITHGTTVTKVDGEYIHLSASHAVPDGTMIKFFKKNKSIIPFSFKVEPNSNTLSITNATVLADQIGWSSRVSVLTNGVVNNSKTIVLDSIKGIKVGDTLASKEILNTTVVKVVSLDSATNITVDTNISLSDNARLTFTNLNDVELVNASKLVIGDDVYIRGHLKVADIAGNIAIPILLDNIITAA